MGAVRAGSWLAWDAAWRRHRSLILAHGAGAPMDSDFMTTWLHALRRMASTCCASSFRTWRSGVSTAASAAQPAETAGVLARGVRRGATSCRWALAIGGKSMGGRMASLLADELGADALVCLGYPFYAVGKPEKPRVEHLAGLKTPTLIVQGERDALGNREAVEGMR
jgi:predicted alpha/beta-hydrolase family hydrolase